MKKHTFSAAALALCAFAAAAHAAPCDTTTDSRASTPLSYSALVDNIANVRCLLDAGADVNATEEYGFTALITATLAGRIDIARLLLERGANVNAADQFGITPLMHAALRGERADIARLLIEKGADVNAVSDGATPLMLAVRRGDADTVRVLLEKGANTNAALPIAEEGGNAEIVQMLRAAGAKK